MRAVAILACVLLTVTAGCLSGEDALEEASVPSGPDVVAAVRGLVGDLPCTVEAVGSGTTGNVKEVARNALDAQGYGSAAEMWIHGSTAFVARYGTGGFNIVDITDATDPVEVGTWDPETVDRGLDVKATSDGTGVLMGGDRGIRLVDVRDAANPVLEHEVVFAKKQAHMLTTFRVAGEEYVGASKGDGQDFPAWKIVGEPGARTLEYVGSPKVTTVSAAAGQAVPEDLARTHDAFFFEDPILGVPTIWFANPWDGVAAYDFSDPAAPKLLSRIPNAAPQYTHTVQTVVVEGKRYTASVAEVGYNTMRLFDTTDLAAPRLLAEWHVQNPGQPQHNLQLLPPYIYVAHYTEGVLVFDFAAAIAGDLTPMARFASEGAGPESQDPVVKLLDASGLFSGAWDVNVKDGLLYVTDGGLRVAAFGCIAPGDALMTSTG